MFFGLFGSEETTDETPPQSKGWGIGDIFSFLFSGGLIAAVAGGLGATGIFGKDFQLMIGGILNKIGSALGFEGTDNWGNGLIRDALTGRTPEEYSSLLQNKTFGPGLSKDMADIIGADFNDFLKALGITDPAALAGQDMKALLTAENIAKLMAADSPFDKKAELFQAALQWKGVPREIAAKLAENPAELLTALKGANIDIAPLLRGEQTFAQFMTADTLVKFATNPVLARRLENILPEIQTLAQAQGIDAAQAAPEQRAMIEAIRGAMGQIMQRPELLEQIPKSLLIEGLAMQISAANTPQNVMAQLIENPALLNALARLEPADITALRNKVGAAGVSGEMETALQILATGNNAALVQQVMTELRGKVDLNTVGTAFLEMARQLPAEGAPAVSPAMATLVSTALADSSVRQSLGKLAELDVSGVTNEAQRTHISQGLQGLRGAEAGGAIASAIAGLGSVAVEAREAASARAESATEAAQGLVGQITGIFGWTGATPAPATPAAQPASPQAVAAPN